MRPLLFCLALLMATLPARAAAPVQVYAAASLKEAVDEAGAAFDRRGGAPVVAVYASSAQLARQIDQGAPADVFISADRQWMDWARAHGRIAGPVRIVAGNALVLVAPRDSALKTVKLGRGVDLARLAGGGRIATGDVGSVPAGLYAKAALTSLGVWPAVKDHLAQGENVRAALAFVARGEAPLGIVYRTDALAEPRVKVLAIFPEDSHEPILYPAARLSDARSSAEAERFLDFLTGPLGRAIFARHGFGPAPRAR